MGASPTPFWKRIFSKSRKLRDIHHHSSCHAIRMSTLDNTRDNMDSLTIRKTQTTAQKRLPRKSTPTRSGSLTKTFAASAAAAPTRNKTLAHLRRTHQFGGQIRVPDRPRQEICVYSGLLSPSVLKYLPTCSWN